MVADKVINGFFIALGIFGFWCLYHFDILSLSLIWKILTAEI